MRRTSVYLEPAQVERLAVQEGRSRAEILREAIDAYQPGRHAERSSTTLR